jgi:hypothetical protein
MRRLLLLIFIAPSCSFGQKDSSSNYKLAIGDSLYVTRYAKSYISSDYVPVVIKNETISIKLKVNLRCDTLPNPAYLHDPTTTIKFIVNCVDYISVTDTLNKQDLEGFKKLLDDKIFILKGSIRIKPTIIRLMVMDENFNTFSFNSKTFDREKIKSFIYNKKGSIYGRILRIEFIDGDKPNMIETDIAFRLQ